ncbi:rap1 gtpase-gdp dissociation stimulator 1 [Holotrichia oblita]|uniref:Rap1 gtpase-gdp dissociation stimulator 1 n=1 Tax=Holotrichia oblita TaxID=644536 RepID=A0ACB9TVI9_HOLOL|nr:rap1 gtpase-gdp dissociation stimulator 1 [Holotrichia oblita]
MDINLQELKDYYYNDDITSMKQFLDKLLSESASIELTDLDIFEILLKSTDYDVLSLLLQCIAELSKQEVNRKVLTSEIVITALINLSSNENLNLVYHCFRALGNISYDNDDARIIIGTKGVQSLIAKVNNITSVWVYSSNPKLLSIVCGCLFNILTSNDALQKAALNAGITSTIYVIFCKILEHFQDQEDCITYTLQVLSYACDHMIDQWLSEELCTLLVTIVQISENAEISVLCLEILRQQSDNDNLKLLLAKLGTCELVYDLVEKYGNQVDDEDSRAALKLACDLIVLILTGDDAMKYLYDNGNGKVYRQMMSWIDSQDSDLVSTGILAIGNFARNDMHCIYMVQSGLSKKLIDILATHNKKDVDTKIQHAVLSTLRHLSIPAQNKSKLIEENILEVLYGMINNDYYPVIFKLMGTFRMLVDGQESSARTLISKKEFIEKIIYWCYNSDHLGVRAEAPSHINSEYLAELLIAADIAKSIEFIIKKYHEKIAFETASNLIKLLSLLSNSTGIIEHFKNCKMNEALILLEKNKNIKELSSDISVLINSFDDKIKNEV